MPAQASNLKTRVHTLTSVLTRKPERQAVMKEVEAANGDWPAALASLQDKLPAASLQKVAFAHTLAAWSDDNVPVVKALAKQPDLKSLRDVALRFNAQKLTALVDPQVIPATTAGATAEEKAKNFAVGLSHKLFAAEPTAVLQRMVQDEEVPIADASVRSGVARFLANQPDFNIRTTSVYAALRQPDAFKGIADEHRAGVAEQMKILQRVQAISPTPEAVPMLMSANLTSAFHVGEMPESTFLSSYGPVLGEGTARQVYTNAINNRIRNEQALMTIREAIRGTGLTILDGQGTVELRTKRMQEVADRNGVPLNLETLFGDMDYCECAECTSVYSPAAYFVDLLQFLRNNNLGPNPLAPNQPNPNIQPGIAGTPLEMLFRRRPDLGCLELTCENTNTVLPYVDLVNEVMESFVVHLDEYHADAHDPKQARLEAFNVEDEISSELLAQPKHTNYLAYCILKNAVYPFTLPYHQPIDAMRIFLKHLGTSRCALLDTYRTATETCENVVLTPAEQQELQTLHQTVLDRAVEAEFLGLTQEEYIILTKEAFWPKRYFDITQKTDYTEEEYRQEIGVKPVHEYYYGPYSAEDDMLSTDETKKKGLTFVKKQFLPRTGIQYTDLVELLKTRFINPSYPQGKALTILESMQYSYRFLQTLVDNSSTDPEVRFATLLASLDWSIESKDLRNWLYCYFDRIGNLIVLESGAEPQLPIEGELVDYSYGAGDVICGKLCQDGMIVDPSGETIGRVSVVFPVINNVPVPIAGPVIWMDGKSFKDKFIYRWLRIRDENEKPIGLVCAEGLYWIKEVDNQITKGPAVVWLLPRDTCDLDKVRLTHLNGTPLTREEYDRIQRFIRLWRKLGWTIDETDKALTGLAAYPVGGGGTPTTPGECDYVGFDTFIDECRCTGGEEDWGCPDIPQVSYEITPAFLHQIVAVRKLLDLTGLPLAKLLSFWADISTAGAKSLYSKLFLTHNLLGMDKVFQADMHGNYLTQAAKITEHVPVLMAALKLKADDVTAVMGFRQLADTLTLPNVSALYRHGLLAKILHVKVADVPEVIALFGDPFQNAYQTLALLETWGQMEDAGFTFRQLNYLIRNHDDALRPLAPPKKTILQLTKTLYDGLQAIDRDHPDVPEDKKEEATAELIRTKSGLLFEQAVVEQIIGLLEGTTVYTTNAPANQTITIPEALDKKLKYNNQKDATPPRAAIQVTGILTKEEQTQAKALSAHPEWPKAIDRVGKQALNFFNDVLAGLFPDQTAENSELLKGDVYVPPEKQDPNLPDPNTAPAKRFYFLRYFLPLLRQRLTHRLIVNTLAGAASLPNDVTDVLLSDVLVAGSPAQSAMTVLEKIKEKPAASTNGWKGYLIPSADEAYTFIATSDSQPAPLLLDGQPMPFPHQQEDPSNIWSTDPTPKLKSGKLHWLEVTGQSAEQLQWKTATSPKAAIPASVLLPDYSAQGTEEVFTKLYKAALLVNGFSLSADEVSYWQTHAADFAAFDFNAVTLEHWQRLQAYTALRNTLPPTETILLDLFKWAGQPDKASPLSAKIADVTGWQKEKVEQLLTPKHFDLNRPEAFRNEVNLVKLQKALQLADKIGVDIDRLFEWAKPTSKYWACHQIAEDIRHAVHARYDQEDWEKVVKPLNDQLREDQKQALISYLLVQPPLIEGGVVDADSLFEFFLIDVQMAACMETSRLKQAISTVQLFIQRCLLGLEEKNRVPNNRIDRDRWEWMQRYRVWEANRKVFLYPENWIELPLRDDKSPFYKELEAELLQKDINTQTVEDALKSYLFKVDEVANLKVVGLFVEQDIDKDGKPVVNTENKPVYVKLHVFARTRNAPYFFYYRYFDIKESNWYPWEKMQVDIPSYDVEDANRRITANGTYLIPVVWNKRLLVFFPQFMKKTQPAEIRRIFQRQHNSEWVTESDEEATTQEIANLPSEWTKPSEFWEIKIAWSEYRNKKWTQKQVAKDVVYDFDEASPQSKPIYENDIDGTLESLTVSRRDVPPIADYQFVPRLVTSSPKEVVIDVYRYPNQNHRGAFHFQGSQITKVDTTGIPSFAGEPTDFHYKDSQIHSLQATDDASPPLFASEPYFDDPITSVIVHDRGQQLNFYHPFAHELLSKLNTGSLGDLFAYYHSLTNQSDKDDAFGADVAAKYHELKRAYSLYNWEAAFYAPMQLVDRLLKSQQFDQALKMCHYVFNPLAKGRDAKRVWQFPPFKEIDAENELEKLFLSLQPGQPNDNINEWRDKPFQPHVVARKRPSAYMKWVVMKYIEILIAYGDYYFRQNTLETIPLAIQCYVLAAHLYGPRGQKIPKRGKVQAQTYNSLLDKWDAFSNAMVELELAFPFSNQTPLPLGVSNGVVGLANIFGFATTLYFCIPDNPKLSGLRDTIDDRLFKIRHCQDIEGVFRQLPLFEPPIEPGLLVQAAAQGLSLASVLNDLNSPMPNYRFYYLLQKALELCTEVKALGNAFLSAKEKGDAEALSQLRARHESSIHNLVMEVKKQQLEEAGKSLEALQQSRKGPVYRLQHYLKLIGEDLGKVPDSNTDFGELPNQIEQPVDESGLKLSPYEKEELDKASEAHDLQSQIGQVETQVSMLHVGPTIVIATHPIGTGVDASWGTPNMAHAAEADARDLRVLADSLSYESTTAGRKGGFQRQLQDRVQQANIAGHEIKNIDKQILTQQIRIAIANQEITNQQKQIDNAQEVEEFLRNKYTNQELYSWMEGQIRTLYYQAYTLAYDMAKKAEKVYRFERGLTTSNFIQFGYWEAAHDGLLAGERLYLGLKQLEAAYQEKRGYDYEIAKPISLRQINPLALLQLKETGTCEFTLPEVLFDMDHPGHYMRRIKSVALTVPCVVGPYTSLNCTLRLLEHKFRTSAIAKDKNDYLEKTDETDERFSTVNVPITSIAVSTGQNDSGVFELNFRDERYIPFEGAGAISRWQIALPKNFRQFDYDTISDVVVHLRYTAVEGGDKLRKPADDSVQDYIKSVEDLSRQEGLFAAFDLQHDFPNEWYKATQPPVGATERLLTLNNLFERLPIFTKGRKPEKIQATDVYLFMPATLSLSADKLVLTQATDEFNFTAGPPVGETMKSLVIKDISCPMTSWQLKIHDTKTEIDKLWLVVRYVLR